MTNDWMPAMMVLASLRGEERRRASEPVLLTAMPGSSQMKNTMGAIAVANEINQGLRRERNVATATAAIIADGHANPITLEVVSASGPLKPIATPTLVTALSSAAELVRGRLEGAVVAALDTVATVATQPGVTPDEVRKTTPALAHVSSEVLDKVWSAAAGPDGALRVAVDGTIEAAKVAANPGYTLDDLRKVKGLAMADADLLAKLKGVSAAPKVDVISAVVGVFAEALKSPGQPKVELSAVKDKLGVDDATAKTLAASIQAELDKVHGAVTDVGGATVDVVAQALRKRGDVTTDEVRTKLGLDPETADKMSASINTVLHERRQAFTAVAAAALALGKAIVDKKGKLDANAANQDKFKPILDAIEQAGLNWQGELIA